MVRLTKNASQSFMQSMYEISSDRDPSLEQITTLTTKIREGWSDQTRDRRDVAKNPSLLTRWLKIVNGGTTTDPSSKN